MNNAVFGITMKDAKKHRDISFVITEARRELNSILTKLLYKKFFSQKVN